MKKWIVLGLTLVAILTAMVAFALPVSAGTYGGLTYTVSNGELTITECATWVSGELIIPAMINGYPVTAIGNGAFRGCHRLASIEISDGVTTIGNYTFRECLNLTSILIPDSVTSIGYSAFDYCNDLDNIEIPDSVTSIGSNAFYGTAHYNNASNWENDVLYIGKHLIATNSGLSGVYIIKDGTLTIADEAFRESGNLTEIKIPDSVTSIGDEAFWECESLTSIEISSNVTNIGAGVLHGCEDVVKIEVNPSNFIYYSEGNCIIEKDSGTLIAGCKSSVIPDDNRVTSIGDGAFSGCIGLDSIEIPDSVTRIGDGAFWGCENLTNLEIPDGVTSIGVQALAYCRNLMSIEIPNSVTMIDEGAFQGCSKFVSVEIPASVTSIGEDAFESCFGLAEIIFHSPDTTIYDSESTIRSDVTIYGPANSTAERYARKYNRLFVELVHTCSFDQQVTTSNYLKTSATCTSPAIYYYSCTCGEKGMDTFESGNTLAHAYDTDWAKDETSHWHECSACGAENDEASHAYDDGKVTKEPTAFAEGERIFACTICDITYTEAIDKLPAQNTDSETDDTDINVGNDVSDGGDSDVAIGDDKDNNDDEEDEDYFTFADDDNDGMFIVIIVVLAVALIGVIAVSIIVVKKKK